MTVVSNNKNYKGNIRDTADDPSNKIVVKAKMREQHSELNPVYMIICLREVNFDDDPFMIPCLYTVEPLLNNFDGLMNLSAFQKAKLFKIYSP